MTKRILIGSLSYNPRSEPTYCLNGKTASALHCPIALVKLLPEETLPDEILLLCTPDLYNSQFDGAQCFLREELYRRIPERADKVHIEGVLIPEGRNPEELWQILHDILGKVPPSSILTLDITHGFRTYPFLYFSAAVFLKALRDVQIEAVYYGLVDVREPVKPIVDVSLILDMIEWFYATRTFRETGQASGLAELLEPFSKIPPGLKGEACRPYSQIKGIRKALEDFSAVYAQALPLELGWEARGLAHRMRGQDLLLLEKQVPLVSELWNQILGFVEPYSLEYSGKSFKKNDILLTENELCRQAAAIDSYLDQGYLTYAIGLIREWVVSVAVFHNSKSGKPLAGRNWITVEGDSARFRMERMLGSLARRKRLTQDLESREKNAERAGNQDLARLIREARQELEKSEKKIDPGWLAEKWGQVAYLRNRVLHHGYALQKATITKEDITKVWSEVKASMFDSDKWRIRQPGGSEVLLVSPLGLSKGLLFSALTGLGVSPSKLWVVSSHQAASAVPEILEKAGWTGSVQVYYMRDSHFGFQEGELLSYSLLPDALNSDRVIVNITGGTTAIQHVIKEAATMLEHLGCSVELVALIDRRPLSEQQSDPYRTGEAVWLQTAGDAGDLQNNNRHEN